MKFSPTVPLALAFAAGMTVAAAAQTTPGTSDSKSTVSEPKSMAAKPMTGSTSTQPGLTDNKAMSSGQMKSTEKQATETKTKTTAEMKARPTRAKRTAHIKAMHPRRTAQMKARPMKAIRTAHLRRPITQAENLTPDQVKTAQQQLQAAGLYNGPIDGTMDPDTRAALARFQQQNGLQRTERLDQRTLARLNANQTTTGFGSSAPSNNQAPPAGAGGNTGQPMTGQPMTR